ncbi:MAG: type II secretion system protein [Phycisphaerae bacterium]|nr:type II secretion system protein [Phycisphaerae bacterium]
MMHTLASPSRSDAPPTAGRRCGGFTLVEVIAAMVIIGTLGGLSGAILYRGIEGYRRVAVQSELHAELAAAMDRIDRAIRAIPSLSGSGDPSIKGVSPTSIDWDEATGGASLSLDAGTLLLALEGAEGVRLLEGVTGFNLQCFDQSNAPLASVLTGATAGNVRRIEITLSVGREGLTDTLRTRVFLRCTMAGSN